MRPLLFASAPLLLVIGPLVAACSSSSGGGAEAPSSSGTPAPSTQGTEIGSGDGTASSVAFTPIYKTAASAQPIDLEFHRARQDELWVACYGDDSVHVGTGVGEEPGTWRRVLDPAARHFMHKPTVLAMGLPQYFGTCGDNDNSQNEQQGDGYSQYFMGPALFSTDPAVFGKRTSTGLGSHMDMLHATPFCRGMAHAGDNWFWAFNAHDNSLDKYNFAEDHGPGQDDHSDGEIYRYVAGQVAGADDGTPSHLFYDATDGFLYVADTGNARVVRLDTAAAAKNVGELPRRNELLAGNGIMEGPSLEVVVEPGVLTRPAGLEVRNDLVYVTDAATSTFHVFDKKGRELRKLATDLPEGSLAGFTFGPDGKVWFTDRVGGRVLRIDPL